MSYDKVFFSGRGVPILKYARGLNVSNLISGNPKTAVGAETQVYKWTPEWYRANGK